MSGILMSFIATAIPVAPSGDLYWRIDNINASGILEFSELQFFNGASQLSGTMTSSVAPDFNSVSALNDGNLSSRCYWLTPTYNSSSFWIQIQLSSSAVVNGIKLGGFDDALRYPTAFTLKSSQDGINFTTIGSVSGLTYPGNFTLSNTLTFNWISLYGDFGVNVSEEYSSAVAYDNSGNIYSMGADGNQGIPFLVKYNSVGQILWQVQFNEINNDYKNGDAVEVDNSGNVYVSIGAGDPIINNFTLIKLDPNGIILWQITFNDTGIEAGTDIAIDSDNNVYVTGISLFTYPQQKVLLIKVNSSGVVQWQKNLAGTGYNYSQGIAIDSSNNIYLNAQDKDILNFSTPYLIKYNSSGVLQWQKQFTDGTSMLSGVVATDNSGYVYTTNYYAVNAGFNLIKWDSNGNIIWQKILNPTLGYPVGIKVDSFGYIYVAASIDGGPWNLAIYKFSNLGSQLWQRKLSSVDGIDTYYYWGTQNLAIYGDKFLVSGFTYTPSLPNAEAIAVQLPTDGSKLGTWGDFTYSVGTQSITDGNWVASAGSLVESVATLSTSTNVYTTSVATGTNTLTSF